MPTKNRHTAITILCFLILVVSPWLAACNVSSNSVEPSPNPELTIQALRFQLTLQAQNAQITALAQTVAAPQQPPTAAPTQADPPTQPVETLVNPILPTSSSKPFIKVNKDAPCRLMPTEGEKLYDGDVIPAGQIAEIWYQKYKLQGSIWWWPVKSPKGCLCWVSEENIETITGDVSGLELYKGLFGVCPK